jgi:DnaJ-class molecular chaperone
VTERNPDGTQEDDLYVDDFGYELECTHCGGEGTCDDGADPLLTCPETLHNCHACGGTGKRRDQRIW